MAPGSGIGNPAPTKVVFLDALGTMVDLAPPWVGLADALGVEVDEALVAIVRTEMGYYREHAHEGRDEASLAGLRERCAQILSDGLGRDVAVGTMMSAISFSAYPDTAPALAAIRELGIATICVSNWDISLGGVLADLDLGDLLDGVVTSASSGSRKPDPGIFEAALELAGVTAGEALHVGDTVEEDIAGAEAAGIRALHLDREGGGDIASLANLPAALLLCRK